MGASDVETIRSGYEAFGRQDIPGVLAVFADDIEWTTPESLPVGGTVRGHDGVGGFFQSLPRYYPELRVEPQEFLDAGDTVVVLGHHHGRAAGGEFHVPFAHVWTMSGGKAKRFREYNDSATLLRVLEA
jgi:uncharacterized protein